MKKYLYWIFVFFSFLFLFLERDFLISRANYLFRSPCSSPVQYRIGAIDKDYQMTSQAFLVKIEKATAIWTQAEGKKLFVYNPQALFSVNLIYTERQSALDKVERLQGELGSGKNSLDVMISEYKSLSADFKVRLNDFNQEVEVWMKSGGAPADVYERLIREQEDLKKEADQLNSMAQKLNQSVENYNIQVGQFNQSVQNYNQVVVERPEAGLYDGTVPKIDIYLTVSDAELIHTLAHEFGHALGLEHVLGDPNSIMYPFSSETTKTSAEDVDSLRAVCKDIRLVTFLKERIAQLQQDFNNLK